MLGSNRTRNGKHRLLGNLLVLFILASSVLLVACGGGEETHEHAAGEQQLYTCGMHPQVVQDTPGNCPICGMKLTPMVQEAAAAEITAHDHSDAEAATSVTTTAPSDGKKKDKKILYWRAPMDPTYISDKPGKSPMGMDLIPVYEGEEVTGGATISIDPVTVQNIGVRTAVVSREPFYRVIRTVGHVDYDEETLYNINLKFDGWIEKLFMERTGDLIQKGQPLFRIYSPELVSTQEEYLLAFQNQQRLMGSAFSEVSTGATSLLQATRQRLKLWDISDAEIRELEQRGKSRKELTIYSPVDGIVVHKTAVEGGYVKAGVDLFKIADLSTVWVYAHIFEYEVPWIHEGQKVQMELPYMPGRMFEGHVDYVYPYLDAKTRDVKIRLVFDNPNMVLKPQMYANITIESDAGDHVLVIPSEAVIRSGQRNLVFIALGKGKFRPQDVVLGPEGEHGMVRVLAGLTGGETIVTSAQFLLDSESRLREAIQKMLEQRKVGSASPTKKKRGGQQDMDDQGHDMQPDETHKNPEMQHQQ